jgi:hypothetical protein
MEATEESVVAVEMEVRVMPVWTLTDINVVLTVVQEETVVTVVSVPTVDRVVVVVKLT